VASPAADDNKMFLKNKKSIPNSDVTSMSSDNQDLLNAFMNQMKSEKSIKGGLKGTARQNDIMRQE